MRRGVAVSAALILPRPGKKYDLANDAETRGPLELNAKQLPQWIALSSGPDAVRAFCAMTGAAYTVQ